MTLGNSSVCCAWALSRKNGFFGTINPVMFFAALVFLLHSPTSLSAQDSAVAYEQHNGDSLPLNISFFDESGQSHRLGDYFNSREPVVILFGYFRCNQLCSVISDAVIDTLRQIRPDQVGAFRLLYISIDPTDTVMAAADAKTRDTRRFGLPGAEQRWHYLTGPEGAIQALSKSVGFRYHYDPPSRQYAHGSGFVIVTPSGQISRYFLGVDFPAQEVASALRNAARGEIGLSVFSLLLLCFHGQGISGQYGPLIWTVMEFSVAATVVGLALLIIQLLRSERGHHT